MPARALPCSLACLLMSIAAALGCGSSEPSDELDPGVVDELASNQGSASGSGWTGSYTTSFTSTSCDCPTLEVQGQSLDLCSLVEQAPTSIELSQAEGFLVVVLATDMSPSDAMLTGAIEADASFVVAGHRNASTLLGSVELLARIDGTLESIEGQAKLQGSAGQRLIAEFANEPIDCRWLGTLEGTRVE